MESPYQLGALILVSVLATLLLTPPVLAFSRFAGLMDVPDERKIHSCAISRLGGVAMAAGFFLALFLFLDMDRTLLAFILGGLIVVGTGLLDDLFTIRPWMKFCGEVTGAVVFVGISGIAVRSFGDLLGTGPIMTGSLAIPITVFCMVGVMNALNLSDGLDGLAGGVGLIAALFLSYLAFMDGQWVCLGILLALAAAVFGFLCFNSHPARIFMGDSGSLLLGYALSSACVMLVNGGSGLLQPVSMAIILALPVLDTLTVMAIRLWHEQSPFLPDKKHLHHRLLALGIPHGGAVSLVYLLMASFGLLALLIVGWPEKVQFFLVLGVAAVLYGLVTYGQHWHVNLNRWFLPQVRVEAEVVTGLNAVMGKSVRLFTYVFPLLLGIPLMFSGGAFPEAGLMVFLALAALLIYPWKSVADRMHIAHGVLYFLTAAFLWSYHFTGGVRLHDYMNLMTLLVSLWVALSLLSARNRHAMLTSGFEMLVLMLCCFLPLFVAGYFHLSVERESALFMASFQAIPFLMAGKILIRRQPRRNRMMVASLAVLLLLAGIQGL